MSLYATFDLQPPVRAVETIKRLTDAGHPEACEPRVGHYRLLWEITHG
jgi:hypothetical protein